MELKRVVVTGLGAITPLGHSVEDNWNAMLKGVSGADDITHFDASAMVRFADRNRHKRGRHSRRRIRRVDPPAGILFRR